MRSMTIIHEEDLEETLYFNNAQGGAATGSQARSAIKSMHKNNSTIVPDEIIEEE